MDNMQGVQPSGPVTPQKPTLPKAVELLKSAWKSYKERFTVFVGIVLTSYVVVAALLLISRAATAAIILPGLVGPYPSESELLSVLIGQLSNPLAILFFVIMIAAIIASVYVLAWGQVALLLAIRHPEFGIAQAYREARSKVLSLLWINILVGLVVVAGLVALVVPGVIFAVWFSLSSLIVVFEVERGWAAAKKSREYVRGIWKEVAWRYFYLIIIWILLQILAGFIGSGLEDVLSENSQRAIGNVIATILGPIAAIYLYDVYMAVKALKESQPVSGPVA